jgi:hypothetical protein
MAEQEHEVQALQHAQTLRHAYGKLVAATWTDPKVAAELKENPARVLKAYGFPPPKGKAHVSVEFVKPTGEGSFQSQQAAWALGESTGHYTIWIPTKPAGMHPIAENGNCTTCTPCCCCT